MDDNERENSRAAKRRVRERIRQQRSIRADYRDDDHDHDHNSHDHEDHTALTGAQASAQYLLTEQLINLVTELGARRVSCFVSVRTEPSTAKFLAWALAHDVDVLLPRSLPGGSLEWVLQSDAPLTQGRYGISEPTGDPLREPALATCDLLLVPAAAVDRRGTRLGWGRGYFDRALATGSRTPTYAVVFEDEVADTLPSEPHDVRVDGAITEVQIHRFD